MRRDTSSDLGLPYEEIQPRAAAGTLAFETDADPDLVPSQPGIIDHDRARALILEQAQRLLPPTEANALADHLVECDRCFRFAQDVAELERKRHSGELKR